MKGVISLCLGSFYVLDPLLGNAAIEKDYAEILKPLLACIHSNPKISFSLYLSGEVIEWIERFHPEFFSVAGELLSKKALEIIGGGFFAPYFPLIPASERVLQIEMLTTAIRKATGKKPRGAWLPSSAWDASMVSLLSGCGIEHVFLDKQMIKHSGCELVDGAFPVTIEECGKTVTAIPLETIEEIKNMEDKGSLERFLANLFDEKEKREGAAKAVFFSPQALRPALSGDAPWLSRLFDLANESPENLVFFTAGQLAKNSRERQRWACIPSGMSPKDVHRPPAGWDAPALCKIPVKQNVISGSTLAFGLYAKMMHVHTLVSQVRGDKARKSAAREELASAQNYLLFSKQDARQAADCADYVYKKLLAAEKLTRQRGVFSDSIASFDYDFDGRKEYLSQTEFQDMHVHVLGGKIFECAVFSSGRNFCRFSGNPSESKSDEGFFVDCFAAKEELGKILSFDVDALPPVFSSNLYQEDYVDAVRREVGLKTSGLYGPFEQPIGLKKRFLFTRSGLQIQFILKNDSPMNLSGIFGTALHFEFSPPKKKAAEVSVFSCEARRSVPQGVFEFPQAEWVLITDSDGGTEFSIEANESPGSVLRLSLAEERGGRGEILSVLLYWPAALSPGYETEKTVFLTIRSARQSARNKSIRRKNDDRVEES